MYDLKMPPPGFVHPPGFGAKTGFSQPPGFYHPPGFAPPPGFNVSNENRLEKPEENRAYTSTELLVSKLFAVLNASTRPISANQLAEEYLEMFGTHLDVKNAGFHSLEEVLDMHSDKFCVSSETSGERLFYAAPSEKCEELQRQIRCQTSKLGRSASISANCPKRSNGMTVRRANSVAGTLLRNDRQRLNFPTLLRFHRTPAKSQCLMPGDFHGAESYAKKSVPYSRELLLDLQSCVPKELDDACAKALNEVRIAHSLPIKNTAERRTMSANVDSAKNKRVGSISVQNADQLHSLQSVIPTPSGSVDYNAVGDEAMIARLAWINQVFDFKSLANIKSGLTMKYVPLHFFSNRYFLMFRMNSKHSDFSRFQDISKRIGDIVLWNYKKVNEGLIRRGSMYILQKTDGFARVIILDKTPDGRYLYVHADIPALGVAYVADFVHLPEAFSLQNVPCNIFIAKLQNAGQLSDCTRQQLVDFPVIRNSITQKPVAALLTVEDSPRTLSIPSVDWRIDESRNLSDLIPDTEKLEPKSEPVRPIQIQAQSSTSCAQKAKIDYAQREIIPEHIKKAIADIHVHGKQSENADQDVVNMALALVISLHDCVPQFPGDSVLEKATNLVFQTVIDELAKLCKSDDSIAAAALLRQQILKKKN